MFEAEALGLGAMYETRTIRVPQPYKVRLFDISDVKDTIFVVCGRELEVTCC